MRPEDALDRAREAADARRAGGAYADEGRGGPLDPTFVPERPPDEVLGEWAVISADESTLYSTRRAGAPVTFLKRLLLRLMRQYLVEVEARQTRFNLAVLSRLSELERRVEAAEDASRREG